MAIDNHLIKQLSDLAKLNIPDEQSGAICSSLNDILNMVAQIQEADTIGVSSLANPLDDAQILRQDQITESDQREELLQLAPQAENGLFLVPKVIE